MKYKKKTIRMIPGLQGLFGKLKILQPFQNRDFLRQI